MKTGLRRGMAALLSLFYLSVCPGCAGGTPEVSALSTKEVTRSGAAASVQGEYTTSQPVRERPECRLSAFHADEAEEMTEGSSVDFSALEEGYVAVCATDTSRLKFLISKGEMSYTYDLPGDGAPTVYPLNMGPGTYEFKLMRSLGDTGTKYARVWQESREVKLSDEFAPWLVPSQMVNYTAASRCVEQAWQLTQGCESDADIAGAVYRYLVEEISYDDEKAKSATSAYYLPDPDTTLGQKKGICFDYASLAAAMLRSQGVPCQLITGYVGENDLYHAWNRFYLRDQGWITAEIQVKGNEWKQVDITFASEGVDTQKLENEGQYTTRYTY